MLISSPSVSVNILLAFLVLSSSLISIGDGAELSQFSDSNQIDEQGVNKPQESESEASLPGAEQELVNNDDKQSNEELESQSLVVDRIIDNKHIWVPFFDPTVTKISESKKAFDTNAVSQFRDLLVNLVKDIVINRKTFGLAKYPIQIVKLVQRLSAESDALSVKEVSKKMDDEFALDGLQIYRDMKQFSLDQDKLAATEAAQVKQTTNEGSKNDEKTKTPKDKKKAKEEEALERKMKDEKLVEDFQQFMATVVETVRESPVGFYVRWSEMKMDEAPIGHKAAVYYDYFKKNGFSGAVFVVDQAVNLITSWKSKSKSNSNNTGASK